MPSPPLNSGQPEKGKLAQVNEVESPTEPGMPRKTECHDVISHAATVYNWIDVTQEFSAATKDLHLGELLHDDLFGLFEAMSAIEMMDPKMDAGMRCNRKNNSGKPMTFESARERGHLKVDDVSNRELLGVMDDTLCCLVTWMEGHSLAQTVFTNLYLHSPFEIEHPGMKAFSVIVLKLIEVIKDIISKGSVYEEEDFQPMSYNFKLAGEVTDVRAGGMVREVEDDLGRIVRATKAKEGEERDEETTEQHDESAALLCRFRLLRQLYQSLLAINRGDLNEGKRTLLACREHVAAMEQTVHMGVTPAKAGENQMGFDRLANQRLLPPTFPRYTEIKSRSEMATYFRRLVEKLVAATAVQSVTNLHAALEFFAEFSSGNPCVLARSALQIMYAPFSAAVKANKGIGLTEQHQQHHGKSASSPPGRAVQFVDILRDTCKSFVAPPGLTSKAVPFVQVKDCIDSFFRNCTMPITILLQAFGNNRARQRDKFAAAIEEFASAQEEAEKLDNMLNAMSAASSADPPPPPMRTNMYFSTWLLYHVLRLMVRYVLSGFELELYSQHEYPYLYWYLYELLYPWLTSCLQRADAFVSDHEQAVEAQQKTAGKNKKKVKGGSGKKSKNTPRPYAREMALYQGYGCLCSAYFKLMTGLKKERKIMTPDRTFDNECVRYEHRFASFANLLTPPLMPYSQFLEVYEFNATTDSKDLFAGASREFTRARQIFESVLSAPRPSASSSSSSSTTNADLESLISVSKVNFVASMVLARDHEGRGIQLDFTPNNTFPTVRIV